MLTYAIIAAVSYLLGSIPFGYILVKVFRKQDIRTTGSGNIGATNVARSGAKGLAVLTLLLDAGKGFLSVLLAKAIWIFANGRGVPGIDCWLCGPLGQAAMIAALASVAGHMFPVWLRFRGGKGVATALGALFLISPVALAASFFTFLIVVGLSRYVSLGSITGAIVYPIALMKIVTSEAPAMSEIWPVIAIAILVILKHHSNIRRLLAGTENRLGAKPKIPPPQKMERQA